MKRILTLIIFLIPIAAWAQEEAVPKLWGTRVHDDAHILSAAFVNRLEQQLKVYEDSTSNQIAILTIRTLNDTPIEEYALRVAEESKIGQEKQDNGALLLVAFDDHKVRIEVGDGLEGVLPDAICNQIIRNEMAPRFRQGDFDGGVQAAVTAMVQAIGGEYRADQAPAQRGRRRGGSLWGTLIILAIIILISRMRGGGHGNRGGGWSSGTGWYGGGFSGRGGGGFGGGGFGGFSGGGGGFSGGGSSGSW